MKRTLYFVMALALVLGLSQCKKEQPVEPENEAKTVNISLKVGGHGGSRHTINTENGDVDFQDGDVIYVGNGSTYIGTLTKSGENFSGDINEPTDGTEIYFFFVGGLTTTPAELSGQSSFTVDISDQSTKMPVLSCNHVTYSSGTTSYSCVLQNQCALVKFTTASGTDDPVHVGGLYTEAQIDFASKTIAHTDTKGFVNLYPDAEDNQAKWAVLLPQTGFEGAEAAIAHVGYTTTIPTIAADGFITGNAAVSISTPNNIVYLDWLTGDYTATNGKILTGTLNGETQPYKINVNTDGATVTLRNATINGKNDKNNCSWAGITCENNTTLVIEGTNNVKGFYEDYPGIHIASGKTLTIQGTGTLNASSNGGADGYGAGIGGGSEIDCGNIVIESGTINATGGFWEAGIGGGYSANCGSITINGGNVTAYGGIGAAGIGTGLSQETITGGGISITGGEVTATGGIGAAGIGSGFVLYTYTTSSTCGVISITGGEVTATGGDGGENTSNSFEIGNIYIQPFFGGAGIGTGSTVNSDHSGASNCGTITIGSDVTRVTATKGGGTHPATNSIGKNESIINPGTCGTVTIGGTVYPDGATPNQTDGLTFVYPVPAPPTAPEGAINGKFTINANGDQVYFSKGNLQYIGSAATPYWKFADHQWEYLGNSQNSTSQTVDRDLFGWATSGYNHNNHSYQPWETNETQANYYAYNNQALNLWQENGQAEWGYNAISNGGNQVNIGWHTLIPARWEYLFYTRTTSSGIRYAKAQVNGVNGMIMLPDDWNTSYYTLKSTNTANAKYNTNVISLENWNNVLEPHGAVFLPDAGVRVGTTIYTSVSCYWTSDQYYTYQNKDQCCNLWMNNTGFSFDTMERYKGASVRLVIDAN